MPEQKATPETGADKFDGWKVEEGVLKVFGSELDLTEHIRGTKYFSEEDAQRIETETKKAATEEKDPPEKAPEEPAKKDPPPKEEAKPKEEPPPKEEPEPEPEKEEPQKSIEYKIKHRGEEKTLKLTPEQVVARLQMAEDYTVKTEELAAKRREIEPYEHVIKTSAFKEWLNEQIAENPELAPKAPPPPAPEDVFAYRIKTQDTDYEEIRSAMREWATASLPEYEQNILASNYRVFNETYDRFAKLVRESRPVAKAEPQEKPAAKKEDTVDPKVREKIIQAKEVHKAAADVEKPGVASDEDLGKKRFETEVKELRKLLRGGTDSQRNEAAMRLLQFQLESTKT